jgi:hypothetical protein
VGENLTLVRRSASGQRILYWSLGITFAVGLAAHVGGFPASAREAVTMYRELAQADPDRYRPDLAASPGVLADSLDLLGRGGNRSAARSKAAALTGGPPGTEPAGQPTR